MTPKRPRGFETDEAEQGLDLVFRTYLDLRVPGALTALGEVLDEMTGVEVVDSAPTPKRTVPSAVEGLATYGPELVPGDTVTVGLQRWSPTAWWGQAKLATVTAFRRCPVGRPEEMVRSPQRPSELELHLPRSVWGDGAGLERLGELLLALADRLDGAWGKVVWTPIDFQHPSYGELDCSVADIGWLNLFGPAYVQHWGGFRNLADLGLYQQRTANGGLLVWTTEDPYVLEPKVRDPRGYAWKQDLIERMGEQAFFPGGDYGEFVPDEREQRAHARQVEDEAAIDALLWEPVEL